MGISLRKAIVTDLERDGFTPHLLFEPLMAAYDGKPTAPLATNKEKTR
ncbi:hypothetical protein ACOBR2_19770 [Telmatobacter bradus]